MRVALVRHLGAVAALVLTLAPMQAQAFVSIWIDSSTFIYGRSIHSYASRAEADNDAGIDCLNKLRDAGYGPGSKHSCVSAVYSAKGCAALAFNGNRWGSGSGATVQRAESKALERAQGGTVMVTVCDFALTPP